MLASWITEFLLCFSVRLKYNHIIIHILNFSTNFMWMTFHITKYFIHNSKFVLKSYKEESSIII